MKRILLFFLFAALCCSCVEKRFERTYADEKCHFLILNDAGENGYKSQKPIAEMMGLAAEIADAKFVISAGDQLHMLGARSVHDPIWITNFETMYTAKSLLWIPWYAVSGNHEYHGDVNALIDYSDISYRWTMPSRYYTFVETDPVSGATVRFIMLDTTPMQAKPSDKDHSDSTIQDNELQASWFREVLETAEPSDWTVVVGHHPLYANTKKSIRQQEDVRKYLLPVIQDHPEIDYYICGHIHTFEHIIKPDLKTEFIVNASAGTDRHLHEGENDLEFYYEKSGFLMGSFDKNVLSFDLINQQGRIVYSIKKEK